LQLPREAIRVTKGTRFDQDQYSTFDQTGLHERLQKDRVRRLRVGGFAQDVCVCASVLDARRLGYEVYLIPGGSLPVSREGGLGVLGQMREAGVQVEEEG
jgi:nicotinamidase/pyrazinamidase